jgi:polysaccharide biosynthesis transport protein
MDFILFSRILLRRKWLILVTSLACAIITFSLSKLSTKSYKSQAQLATGITDNFEVTLSESKDNRDEIKNKYNNLSEFLRSKDLLTLLSYRLVLHEFEAKKPFRPKKLSELKSSFKQKEWKNLRAAFQAKYDNFEGVSGLVKEDIVLKNFAKDMDYDYATLEKMLSITRIVETDYVEAKVSTENPYLSSFLVNSFCEEAIRFNIYQQTKRSQHSLDFIGKLVDQKKENLDKKMDSLKLFKELVAVVNHETETLKKIDQIADLESKRNEEIKNVNSLKRVVAHLERQTANKNDIPADNAYINNKIYALKDKIADISNRNISSGKKDRIFEDSLRILRKQLNALVEKLQEETQSSKSKEEIEIKKINAEIELEQAISNLATLENTLSASKMRLAGHTVSGNQVSDLQMAVEIAKQEYLKVQEKYNIAKNVAINSGMLLRQIEYGEPADEPEPSKTIILTILSMVFCVSMFVVFFFVREYLDNTLKTPYFFKKQLSFSLLGVINYLSSKNIQVPVIFSQKDDLLENLKFREYLRKLRVEFAAYSNKTVLFTSLKEGEGKSFVLFSIAYSLSIIGRRILIIDTNFKNNTLTTLFSAPQQLPDVAFENNYTKQLQENSDNKTDTSKSVSVFHDVNESSFIHDTLYKNIQIIGCKGSELSPSELFQDKNFGAFLNELKTEYDFIFLEGPSLNEYSDSKELINDIDKIVTVFAADTTITQNDQMSIEYLKELNEKHIGSILNMVNLKNMNE